MMKKLLYLFCMLCVVTHSANALVVDKKLPDQAQEARAKAIFHQLRCMVCAGESLADSPAEVAADMRGSVRQLVANGKSEREILDYFAQQYGQQVWMKPSVEAHNLLLWFAPLIVLVAGLFLMLHNMKKRAR